MNANCTFVYNIIIRKEYSVSAQYSNSINSRYSLFTFQVSLLSIAAKAEKSFCHLNGSSFV